MLPKALKDITFSDLEAIVASGARESKTLDFKRQWNDFGSSDKKKIEFLNDIASFANASGGDIVYGVVEEKGAAVSVEGCDIVDPDALILSLGQIIGQWIEPRLPVEIRWI